MVLPAFNLSLFQNIATAHGLFITKLTEVIAIAGKAPYLVLLQLECTGQIIEKTEIIIEDITGNFSDQYKAITKDFYLKF